MGYDVTVKDVAMWTELFAHDAGSEEDRQEAAKFLNHRAKLLEWLSCALRGSHSSCTRGGMKGPELGKIKAINANRNEADVFALLSWLRIVCEEGRQEGSITVEYLDRDSRMFEEFSQLLRQTAEGLYSTDSAEWGLWI